MFIDYLKEYFAGFDLTKGKNQVKDPRTVCFRCIDAVFREEKHIDHLGRVFNQFPFSVKSKLFVEEKKIDEWVKKYNDFLEKLLPCDNTVDVLSIEQGMKAWTAELIQQAAADLLSQNQLKSEIIQLLQLNSLITKYLNESEEIKMQILYSYIIQLLFGLVHEKWKESKDFNPDKGEKEGLFTRFFIKLFRDQSGWAPFFQSEVTQEVVIEIDDPYVFVNIKKNTLPVPPDSFPRRLFTQFQGLFFHSSDEKDFIGIEQHESALDTMERGLRA
ncbi:MAG: hypothetical protein ACD_60C00025G0096 [uncultured bacterium]|nr:MAG: hypothetical protein ACD_60C00025G0096 [uncultured bacterium]